MYSLPDIDQHLRPSNINTVQRIKQHMLSSRCRVTWVSCIIELWLATVPICDKSNKLNHWFVLGSLKWYFWNKSIRLHLFSHLIYIERLKSVIEKYGVQFSNGVLDILYRTGKWRWMILSLLPLLFHRLDICECSL